MKPLSASIVGIDDPSWVDFVVSHPQGSVFHMPAWVSVVADTYGFRPFAIVVLEDGEILAGCPVVEVRGPLGAKRWISVPFTDSCEFLVRDAPTPAMVEELRRFAGQHGVSDFEIRAAVPTAEGFFPVVRGYHHTLLLPADPADVHLRKSYRNLRNKARKAGVIVTRGDTARDIDAFYRLHVMTRRRHGVPVQPKRFFDLIASRMAAPGNAFVLTAEFDGQPAASSLYLTHGNTIVTKFAASNPDMRDLGAGHLLDWVSIEAACHNGFRVMDWGRTDLDAEGLRAYKLGWGAHEDELVYTHTAPQRPARPVPSRLEAATHTVIAHSPEWVCRMLGRMLYRWVA